MRGPDYGRPGPAWQARGLPVPYFEGLALCLVTMSAVTPAAVAADNTIKAVLRCEEPGLPDCESPAV